MTVFRFLSRKHEPVELPADTVRRRYRIYGRVQGVGFRYRALYAARSLYLTGWVENMDDGSVCMEVQGPPDRIDQMLPLIRTGDYIHITHMDTEDVLPDPRARGFEVRGY